MKSAGERPLYISLGMASYLDTGCGPTPAGIGRIIIPHKTFYDDKTSVNVFSRRPSGGGYSFRDDRAVKPYNVRGALRGVNARNG